MAGGLLGAIGGAISGAGQALDLPDLGIGKALGSTTSAPGALQGVSPYAYQGVASATPTGGQPQVLGAATAAPAPNPAAPPAAGAATTGTTGANPAGLASYLQAAGLQQQLLGNDLGTVGTMQNQAQAGINAQANDQGQALNNQYAQGQSANTLAGQQLNTQRSQSLADLASQLRGMYNSDYNQLGVAGAGNSSASDLLSQALTQEANSGRYNIGQQFGEQQTGINQNASNLSANFQQQQQALNDWKNQQLNQIVSQYAGTRQDLENQMASIGSDEARTALYMQDQAAANQALQQMQQTVASFGNVQATLNSQYQTASQGMPQSALNNAGYQVQQFSPVNLPGLSFGQNAAPTSTTSTAQTFAPVGMTQQQTPQPGTIASLNNQ